MTDARPDVGAVDRWGEAARRVDLLIQNGQPVRFFSLQASLIAMIVVMAALAIAAGFGTAVFPLQLVLIGAALVLAVTAYVRARRSGKLLPSSFTSTANAMQLLTPDDRRLLNKQWRGSAPVTPQSAPLITAIVRFQQMNNRTAALPVIAMRLGLVGVALGLSPAFLVVVAAAIVIVAVVLLFETRRLRRISRDVSNPDR